jgi:uncharacterized membrane protein
LDLDRIVFFSDAVIAIALTLLAIELVPPQAADDDLGRVLLKMRPEFATFGLCFVAITAHWAAHDPCCGDCLAALTPRARSTWCLLLAVVLLPFSTNLLATT